MQVTLQVDGNDLAPTLKEIIESMTDEDKRDLAAKISFEYFKQIMDQEISSSSFYGNKNKAAEYMEELSLSFRSALVDKIKNDPEMSGRISDCIKAIEPLFPKFVQAAVTHIMATQMSNTFANIANNEMQIEDIKQKLAGVLT